MYRVVTIARDEAGNAAECSFTISIAPNECAPVSPPQNANTVVKVVDGTDAVQVRTIYHRLELFRTTSYFYTTFNLLLKVFRLPK